MPQPNLLIRKVFQKGRRVFAAQPFKKGDTIETCQIVILSSKDRKAIDKTLLYNYYFTWGKDKKKAALALGFCSLYNHSYTPNARYHKDIARGEIRFIAVKNIAKGEEIITNYNWKVNDQTPVWFEKQ